MKRYFLITCVRGHCGTGGEGEIKFAIKASNLIEAMDRAKQMPSVKHTRIPLVGKEINNEEYVKYREISAYERYEQHKASCYRKVNKKKRRR